MNSEVHELKLMNSKFMNLTNFMNLAISCSWIVHELFMNKCSWTAHELFKNHSWTVYDHFTGVLAPKWPMTHIFEKKTFLYILKHFRSISNFFLIYQKWPPAVIFIVPNPKKWQLATILNKYLYLYFQPFQIIMFYKECKHSQIKYIFVYKIIIQNKF